MAAGLNDTILNIGATAMQGAATHASIHTATPDGTGSNESTAARQAITWVTASGGDMVATADLAFTGGTASGDALYVGLWSASTAGTFYGYFPLTGDQAFNAAGEYTLTGITVTGTAS